MDMTSNKYLPYIYKEKLFDVRKVVFTTHPLQKHSQAFFNIVNASRDTEYYYLFFGCGGCGGVGVLI